MARCERSCLGAIPCLVSCQPQRILHDNVKTFDAIFKRMGKESIRAAELALEGRSLSWPETQFSTLTNQRTV